jgi:dTDP-4-amino-4,6-dideoxygalactose transaminase
MTENKEIRLSKSVVGAEEAEAVARVILESGYLGMGRDVQLFEDELREFLGTDREVICANSGTAALHLAVMASVEPGCEVLVQSLTYLASFQAISAAGCVPVPCEVIPETVTIDLNDAEKRITERTKAIMPVHYASGVGDLDSVYEFAEKHGLRVIEDAAHAFGTIYKGRKVGTFGDIACFSFDGIKNITSGEGGAVVTGDEKVAARVKDTRLLGGRKDTEKRYSGQRSWELEVTHQGYRYHMSNLFASIGRVQLKKFPRFKKIRQHLARRYVNELKGLSGITLLDIDFSKVVPHIFPIKVQNGKRDALRQFLIDGGIGCGVHYYPNHLLEYYGARKGLLPVTESVYEHLLTLPLHPDLNEKDQDRVVKRVREFFRKNCMREDV